MTLEEAKKVASILRNADGGCSVCVRELVTYANKDFPEFTWSVIDDEFGLDVIVEKVT